MRKIMGTKQKNRREERRSRLTVENLEDRMVPSTYYTWDGATSDWNTGTNWTPNGLPGTGDTAYITSSLTSTIQLSADVTVDTLDIEAGFNSNLLDLNGHTLTVTGTGTLTGGTILVANNTGGHHDGTITFGSASTVTWGATWGTTDFDDTDGGAGTVNFNGTTTVSSGASSGLDMQSNLTVNGTLNWNTPLSLTGFTATSTIDGNNTGLVTVSGTGTMTVIGNGGTPIAILSGMTGNKANGVNDVTIAAGGNLNLTDAVTLKVSQPLMINGNVTVNNATTLGDVFGNVIVDGSCAILTADAGSTINSSVTMWSYGTMNCEDYASTLTAVTVNGNVNMVNNNDTVNIGANSDNSGDVSYVAGLVVNGNFDSGFTFGTMNLYMVKWSDLGTDYYQTAEIIVNGNQDTSGAGATLNQYWTGGLPSVYQSFDADFVSGTLAAGSWPVVNPATGFTGAWAGKTFQFSG